MNRCHHFLAGLAALALPCLGCQTSGSCVWSSDPKEEFTQRIVKELFDTCPASPDPGAYPQGLPGDGGSAACSQGTDACSACVGASCCAEVAACFGDPACACLVTARCDAPASAAHDAVTACVTSRCGAHCGGSR